MSKKKRRPQPSTSKTSQRTALTVNLSKHEAPIAGFADRCALLEREDVVEFIFLESRIDTPPVSVASFFMTYSDLAQTWVNTQEFRGKMEGMADRASWGNYPVISDRPKDLPARSSPAPMCTVIVMAKIGAGALIECYYVTATSTLRVTQGVGQPKIVPLFSVQMPAGLMWNFVEGIRAVASSNPKAVPHL